MNDHSTEYAVVKLSDNILKDIDDSNISLAIFMNLSKAIDTLDHEILINKLVHCEIRDTALQWFTSYLKYRSQYVEIDGVSSYILPLCAGVSQGSKTAIVSHIYERYTTMYRIF